MQTQFSGLSKTSSRPEEFLTVFLILFAPFFHSFPSKFEALKLWQSIESSLFNNNSFVGCSRVIRNLKKGTTKNIIVISPSSKKKKTQKRQKCHRNLQLRTRWRGYSWVNYRIIIVIVGIWTLPNSWFITVHVWRCLSIQWGICGWQWGWWYGSIDQHICTRKICSSKKSTFLW